ncbi:hypothetical protein COCC4DRAFT_66696 [Bipolaris maydis ATCC 48331]|uniref:Uncharacterized protein n=2 Tax=Cochliobolus heterostrophus TaxID=5016 RepID=M2U450_COCH5|nr:uncharacterized protein COCC4DRAFT_66696 [Bipolaris maydis ATCC 48331]EMD88521.1 hypothetical protein COCHEDRAFT_1032707 [Bipolaris maydis C5]KAJ5026310.1 hypothetical protein J3E73DRAFT_370633 [Bipolaris maydis]ENH99160.1 hypothetical protein COCC4DRAFT_66696 [Bipolaris maydis ATCC 48331]KAJ5051392.1 hypothetical protein J3E74DRAFT_295790 [Bipolaris maydis]KAJ6196436.1 hypothetical protein J3E72DRAFT_270408 [Bipolaris maydis]
MKPTTYLAAILGLATTTIASPIEGSSAIQARDLISATVTCTSGITSAGNGPALYNLICTKIYGCQDSLAPQELGGEYVGACFDCPAGVNRNKVGDCVYAENA